MRAEGLGFKIEGRGFRVHESIMIEGRGFRVCLGFNVVQVLEFKVVYGVGFSGLAFKGF